MVSRAELLAMLEAGDVTGAIEALKGGSRGRAEVWPWRSLEVGESFFAPVSARSMRAQAANAAKRTGRRFRVVERDGGCEVFLIA